MFWILLGSSDGNELATSGGGKTRMDCVRNPAAAVDGKTPESRDVLAGFEMECGSGSSRKAWCNPPRWWWLTYIAKPIADAAMPATPSVRAPSLPLPKNGHAAVDF